MIYYFQPLHVGSYTLSIDNIVLDLWISNHDAKEIIDATINSLTGNDGVEIVSWEGNKPGSFRNQHLFKLTDDKSFWLGHGLIATGIYFDRYRLEFNPNKVANNKVFKAVHRLLIEHARDVATHVARFDLAIDIPVDRAKCFLVKDRRMYIERRHGAEYTQYGRILIIIMMYLEHSEPPSEIVEAWCAINIKTLPLSLAEAIWPDFTEEKILKFFLFIGENGGCSVARQSVWGSL